jgi:hypothetical protein
MPDQPLKPFGSRTACPKCGSPHAYAQYWFNPQGKQLTVEWVKRPAMACFSRQYVEHVRRTCSRCGFTWHEAPLDAKKESQDAEPH